MRLLAFAGLGDYASDLAALEAQVKAGKEWIVGMRDYVRRVHVLYGQRQFGGVSYDQYMSHVNDIESQIAAKQEVVNDAIEKINKLNSDKANAEAKAEADKAAKAQAKAQTPFEVAEAERKAVRDLRRTSVLMMEPGYDYGMGSNRRNQFYRGLGGNMNNLLALDRPSSPLGDIWGDLYEAGREGVRAVKAEGSAPKINLSALGLPKINGGVKVAPWVSTFAKTAAKRLTKKPAAPANIGTGGVASMPEPAPSGPNWLLLGLGAVALGGGAYVFARSSR